MTEMHIDTMPDQGRGIDVYWLLNTFSSDIGITELTMRKVRITKLIGALIKLLMPHTSYKQTKKLRMVLPLYVININFINS